MIMQIVLCIDQQDRLLFPWLFKMLKFKSGRVDPDSPEGDLGETIV